jgi:hypothetical protein
MSELLTPDEIARGLLITVDSYTHDPRHHDIADRLLEALGYRPDQIVEMRINRSMICLLVRTRRPGREPIDRWQRWTISGEAIADG